VTALSHPSVSRPAPWRLFGWLAVALLVAAALIGPSGVRAAESVHTVTTSSIEIDGDSDDWDLEATFLADLHEAGDASKAVLAKVYAEYECSTGTIYFLVLAEGDHEINQSDDDNFVKIDDVKMVDGNSSTFAYIDDNGWEASFSLAEGTYTLDVHAQIDDGDTAALVGRALEITVECPEDTPAPATDTPAPATDTPAPATDTPAPATDTPAPATDTPAPATDTPAPATDTPAPATGTPAPSPTGGVQPTEGVPTATPTGGVGGVTGAPTVGPTLPPTDLESQAGPSGDTWRLLFLALAGIIATMLVVTPVTSRRRR
jgi:hypothetical protein